MPQTPHSDAFLARAILRAQRKAALATLDAHTGAPYASLVAVASALDGRPVTLLSTLARHSANLAADCRASLLFEAAGAKGDILAEGRVSVMGRLRKTADLDLRRRFLARHPESAGYADFADFAFYMLDVEEAHFVGGFGRIKTLPAGDFLLGAKLCAPFATLEEDALAHMNGDHADTVMRLATARLGARAGDWRLVGLDPEGADLACGGELRRLDFAEAVSGAPSLRRTLAALREQAGS